MNLKLWVVFIVTFFASFMVFTHYSVVYAEQVHLAPSPTAKPQLEGECYVRVEPDGTRVRICENVKK